MYELLLTEYFGNISCNKKQRNILEEEHTKKEEEKHILCFPAEILNTGTESKL